MFKVGDICILKPIFDPSKSYEVIIRGPANYDDFAWTVENLNGSDSSVFHRCHGGEIEFDIPIGRWALNSELTYLRGSKREPTRFGKFIRAVEARQDATK